MIALLTEQIGGAFAVPLYKPKSRRLLGWALVDIEDYARVAKQFWTVSRKTGLYPRSCAEGRGIVMHRFVLGLGHGDKGIVHHLNGVTIDNRRSNLHICADHAEHARLDWERRWAEQAAA